MRSKNRNNNISRFVRGIALSNVAAFALITCAKADPHQNLFIGGAQYSASSQSAYLGLIDPLPGSQLGDGYFISPFVGLNRYTFVKNGQTFTGSQPNATLGIGRAFETKNFDLSLSIAGGYSNTTITPYAPSGSFRGGKWFLEPSVYAHASLPYGASLTVNGGYLTGLRSFYASSYLLFPVTQAVSIGPEYDTGGGTNYRNHTIALRLADQVTNALQLDISVGATTNVPGFYHPYIGFNLTSPF